MAGDVGKGAGGRHLERMESQAHFLDNLTWTRGVREARRTARGEAEQARVEIDRVNALLKVKGATTELRRSLLNIHGRRLMEQGQNKKSVNKDLKPQRDELSELSKVLREAKTALDRLNKEALPNSDAPKEIRDRLKRSRVEREEAEITIAGEVLLEARSEVARNPGDDSSAISGGIGRLEQALKEYETARKREITQATRAEIHEAAAVARGRLRERLSHPVRSNEIWKAQLESKIGQELREALEGRTIRKVVIEAGNFYVGEGENRDHKLGLDVGVLITKQLEAMGIPVQKVILYDDFHHNRDEGAEVDPQKIAIGRDFSPDRVIKEKDYVGDANRMVERFIQEGKAIKDEDNGNIVRLIEKRKDGKGPLLVGDDGPTCAMLEVPVHIGKVREEPDSLCVTVLPESYKPEQKLVHVILEKLGEKIPTLVVYFNPQGEISSKETYHLDRLPGSMNGRV